MDHKKVLLIYQSPFKRKVYINIAPPLGLLSISSYLDSRGIPNEVIDCNIGDLREISIKDFDIIGFSVNIANAAHSLHCAEEIKKEFPHKKIIFGGPHCTGNPVFFAEKKFIDAVIIDEGEETFYDYLTKDNLREVKGLYFKNADGQVIFTNHRGYIKNLNLLPFPALDKIDLRKYNYFPKKALPISSIITSRGCPYKCTFCFHGLGFKWRCRSPENVVDEIDWQVNKLGIKELRIYDDNFALDRERAEKICDLILEKNIKVKIRFANGIRFEHLDKKLLKKLKEAGTYFISIAPESGSLRTLRRLNKWPQFDEKKLIEIIDACKELQILTFAFFMIGLPWETESDISDTIRLALRLDTDMAQFTKFVFYSKIPLYYERAISNSSQYDYEQEKSHFYCEDDVGLRKMMKKAYRSFYLRPTKILNLLRNFSLDDLLRLAKFAIITKNI